MKLDLAKGMKLDLTKEDSSSLVNVSVGVNWGKIEYKETKTKKVGGFFGFGGTTQTVEEVVAKESVDLDISAILYDKNNNHISTVYYAREEAKGIKHSGDDRGGDDENDGKDNETIILDLPKTQPEVHKIVFVLVSFKGQRFGLLPYAGINIYDGINEKTKIKLASTDIDLSKDPQYQDKVSMIFASLYRTEDNRWEYKAICEPTKFNTLSELERVAGRY